MTPFLARKWLLFAGTAALLLVAAGCGRGPTKEVIAYKRHLLDAIISAISEKDPRWLDRYAARVTSIHRTGQLSDDEYLGLRTIINQAKKGDWAAAEKDARELRRRPPFSSGP